MTPGGESVPATFLTRTRIAGTTTPLRAGTAPEDVPPGRVLVVHRWTPVHVVPFMSAAAAVILARSATTHAAVVALQLGLPACVVDPALWPAADPRAVVLDPDDGEIRW